MDLPTGTLTFLFTDIEGSTRLMQEMGDRYVQAQVEHHAILREAFKSTAGRELRTEGDSFFCVFESALDACGAAAQAQRGFIERKSPFRVRVGLHTGEAQLVGEEYIGLDVHHAARVAAAAHGGQVVISETTHALVHHGLPLGLTIRELGIHRLKDLARAERLYQLVIEGVPDAFPALRTLDATPNNLPTQLTSFIGRTAVVDEAKRLLGGTRLLTLTGPGGIGKTRLSLQLATEVTSLFPDGTFFVALSAVTDAELISSAIAQSTGLHLTDNRQPLNVVLEYLRDKTVLLILDNLEQLLPAAAPGVSDLLHQARGVKLVVTTRAPLHVYGEQEMALEPLRLPDLRTVQSPAALSQSEAVKLFIERAVAAKHDFRLTNENAPAVAGICEHVDGLPLAIELAAARVKLFSPKALLARLETSTSVLAEGPRDLTGRQQTLRGAITWSYELLDGPHKRLFARFGVFARGASLEQAEAVCGPESELGFDVLEGLDELADQSLLRRVPDFDEPRLLMLQVLREYALERLEESGEANVIRDRHAEAFQALAEEVAPHLFGAQRKAWLDRLEVDHDNIRAAFDWAQSSGDVRRALGLGSAFWRFWQMRGHVREGRARLDAILAMPGAAEVGEDRAHALEAAGGVAHWQGDVAAEQRFYDECLELARAAGDEKAIANALYNASFPRFMEKRDMPESLRMMQEALALYRELGDDMGVARTLSAVATAHHQWGEPDKAIQPAEEAIALHRKLDDRFSLGWALHTRVIVAMAQDDIELAWNLTREALEIFGSAGDLSGVVMLLDDAASIAKLNGDSIRALRLAGAAAGLREQSGATLGSFLNVNEGRAWQETIEIPEEQRAWAQGEAMSVDQAVDYALGRDVHSEEHAQ